MNGTPWTAAQLTLLKRIYPSTATKLVAKRVGHPLAGVYGMATMLGLKKSAAFHQDAKKSGRFNKLTTSGVPFRFPKGNVPANKSLRRPGYAPGRMRETQFKKGGFPVNRDPDFYVLGALRVNADGYIDMRVSFARGARGWKALHRILWEDAHGPIPAGHKLVFKNGDKLDVELDNIELISDAELLRRNSIHRYPQDLHGAMVALGQFKRRLREEQDRRSA